MIVCVIFFFLTISHLLTLFFPPHSASHHRRHHVSHQSILIARHGNVKAHNRELAQWSIDLKISLNQRGIVRHNPADVMEVPKENLPREPPMELARVRVRQPKKMAQRQFVDTPHGCLSLLIISR
jgi:hypothetical protein